MIQVFLLTLLFLIASCNKHEHFVQITKDLKWVYFDETDSALLWKDDLIVGSGSITLKCEKNYVWGMCHKNNVSLFFMINLKTGDIIKNPDIKDVVCKYNIMIDINKSYTQSEIFGEHRSRLAIERLQEDIKQMRQSKSDL